MTTLRRALSCALLTLLFVPAGCATTSGSPTAVAAPAAPRGFAVPPGAGTKATCPVSGEAFTVADDTEIVEHGGKHYAFCCAGCAGEFGAEPSMYADK